MKNQLGHLAEALWLVLTNLGLGFLAARVFVGPDGAFLFGLILAGLSVAIYLALIFTDNAGPGLPWTILFLALPVAWGTGVMILWITRWILEQLGLFP